MAKYIYNEKNGIGYELQGDYYLPCLKLPSGKRNKYLADIESASGRTVLSVGKYDGRS